MNIKTDLESFRRNWKESQSKEVDKKLREEKCDQDVIEESQKENADLKGSLATSQSTCGKPKKEGNAVIQQEIEPIEVSLADMVMDEQEGDSKRQYSTKGDVPKQHGKDARGIYYSRIPQ